MFLLLVPGVGSVKALAQGPSSANLSWTLAFSGGSPITKFVIEFRRNDSSAWHPALTVPWNETGDINKMASDISPDIRQTTIFGLEAREFYQFRMAASNRLGMGPFSVTTQAILSNSKGVPSPPSRPVVTGWGPNQVVISTSIPKIGSDSSLRLGVYEILNETKTLRVVELDYQEGEAVTLVWENTSYHGDLSFQVFAVNLFGPSLPSEDSLKGSYGSYCCCCFVTVTFAVVAVVTIVVAVDFIVNIVPVIFHLANFDYCTSIKANFLLVVGQHSKIIVTL